MPNVGCRRFPTHTKLGALMDARGLRVIEVSHATGIYPRTMTEYLAGRKRPSQRSIARLVDYFGLPAPELIDRVYPVAAVQVEAVAS